MGFLYERLYWDGLKSIIVYSEGNGSSIILLVYDKRAIVRRVEISLGNYSKLQTISKERVYSECEKTLARMINFIDFNYR